MRGRTQRFILFFLNPNNEMREALVNRLGKLVQEKNVVR